MVQPLAVLVECDISKCRGSMLHAWWCHAPGAAALHRCVKCPAGKQGQHCALKCDFPWDVARNVELLPYSKWKRGADVLGKSKTFLSVQACPLCHPRSHVCSLL